MNALPPSPAPTRRAWWIGLLLIALATAGVYWHGLGNGLVFDDSRLTDGTLDTYGTLWPWQQRLISYGSFVWLQQWLGENWAAQRALNLLLHLATTAAVGLLAHALLRQWLAQQPAQAARSNLDEALDQRLSPQELRTRADAAWLIAVGWFALNPVAVYAAGYLIQRAVVMLALFTALACWAWVRCLQVRQAAGPHAPRSTGLGWAALAAACALGAFLSKEHGALVPLLAAPLYLYIQRPPLKRVALSAALALAACAVLAAILWPRFGHVIGAAAFDETSAAYVRELERLRPGAAAQAYGLSIFNQAGLFFAYLGYWLAPYVGAMSIDMRPAFPLAFTEPLHLAGALAFVAVLAASVWALLARRDGWSLLGLSVVCVALLFGLELATTWIQDPFVLYRSYLWAIFLPAPLALVLALMLPRKAIYLAGCVALAALAALSYERISSFQSAYSVWSDAASKIDTAAPPQAFGRWRPFMNRGAELLERESAQAALEDFDRAIALGEPLGSAQFSRGMALQLLGRYAESVQAFHAAEKLGMQPPSLYYQAAFSLRGMGAPQNALAAIEEGLKRQPDAATSEHLQQLRAEIYTALGQHELAARQYQLLLELAPHSGKYRIGLGMAHLAQEQYPQAQAQIEQALAQRESASAYFARALLHARTGQAAAALADVDKAIALEPQNPMYAQLKAQLQAAPAAAPRAPVGPLRELAPGRP